jgi:AraC family transcriptional regulator
MRIVAASDDSRSRLVRDLGLEHILAGPCESAPADVHRLSINTGPPVWATHRLGGHSRRHYRSSGRINFVPAGTADSWILDDPLTLLKLSVPRRLMRAAAKELDLDVRTLEFRPGVQVREAQIEWIARALGAEADAGNPNGFLFSESLMLALSIALVRHFGYSSPATPSQTGQFTPAQLNRITDYVEDNLGRQDLSLYELSAVAGTSVSHFKALFKRSTGTPAHRFVIQRRVERAAGLLQLGELSITDVAAETGFAHASHLTRWTRRLLGVSPGDLRQRT